MQEDTSRTAFNLVPALKHRTQDAARRITSVSLDSAAARMFIGLASGHVEEHQILTKQLHLEAAWSGTGSTAGSGFAAPTSVTSTRLVAEKRVSRQPILALACLPTASRLAILCEDGTASVAAYDTWAITALPGVRTAMAIAADPGPAAAAAATALFRRAASEAAAAAAASATKPQRGAAPASSAVAPAPSRPVRIAVAVKSMTTVAKLLVYSISPSVGFAANQPAAQLLAQIPLAEPVQAMIWVGSGLFVQHHATYNLLQPGGRVTQIAEHGCAHPCMAAAPWPSGSLAAAETAAVSAAAGAADKAAVAAAARGALLFQDSLLLLTDGNGTAVVGSEPIAVSEPPLALCSSGQFMVLVSDAEGVLVYDRATSRLVQRIFWSHDDPWVAAARSIPVAEDASGGGAVAVATSSVVMLLQPVAMDVQARELLKRKRFDAALALIRGCRRAGEQWADTALAQAGLLMLQELRCEDALAALEEVGPATFQPAQLLALFPRVARRWLSTLPHRSYWGLHGSLMSLERICEDFLELRNSTSNSPRFSQSPSVSAGGVTPLPPSPPSSSVLTLAASAPDPHAHHHHHHHHHHHPAHRQHHGGPHGQHGSHGAGPGTVPRVGPVLPAEGSSSGASIAGLASGGALAALMNDAHRHILAYLMRTRGSTGVQCLDGIDTLLVHLLVETGETASLEVFLGARELLQGPAAASDEAPLASAGASGETHVPTIPTVATAPVPASSSASGPVAGRGGAVRAVAGSGTEGPVMGAPPAQVSPRDAALVALLEGAGRWHALAVLRAARGQVPQALELWQRLALEEVAESPSRSGAVAEAAAASECPLGGIVAAPTALPDARTMPPAASVAEEQQQQQQVQPGSLPLPGLPGVSSVPEGTLHGAPQCHVYGSRWAAAAAAVAAASAGTLMARPGRTPPLLCLSKLPWLLGMAPDWALHAMRSRPLPVADVMSLLQRRSDGVRWQYLHHLVYSTAASAASASAAAPAGGPSRSGSAADRAAAAVAGSNRGDGQAVGGDASDASVPSGGAGSAASSAPAVPWYRDPSLHTELALELVECIALLQARAQAHLSQVMLEQHQQPRALPVPEGPTAADEAAQQQGQQPEQEQPPQRDPGRHGEGAAEAIAAGGAGGGSAPARSVSEAAAHAVAQLGDAISALPYLVVPGDFELPPALPPLPRPANGLRSGSVAAGQAHPRAPTPGPGDVDAAAAAAAVVSGRPCSPPPVPDGGRSAGHSHGQQHHQRPPTSQHTASQMQRVMSPTGASHAHTADGVRHLTASTGAAGAPAGTSAAAGAPSTAGGLVATADLAWLGTLGVVPAAAVAKQLRLAVRGALVAAGQDPDLDAGAADSKDAGSGVGGGDSLALLRALSAANDGVGVGSLGGLRAVLQHHLYASHLYDPNIVLQVVRSSPAAPLLLRETAQLHCRQSDHPLVLGVVALLLHDVDGAICYCRARCGQEGWLALLDLLLRPGGDRQPDYVAACRVLAAEGAALAPLQVLEALSDDMPLHLAHGTLSRMVGSVLHHKRQGQVMRALHRAQNLALRWELAQLQANRVSVSEETPCRGCQRPLGTKVFYRYPSGVVLCARCVRPDVVPSSSG